MLIIILGSFHSCQSKAAERTLFSNNRNNSNNLFLLKLFCSNRMLKVVEKENERERERERKKASRNKKLFFLIGNFWRSKYSQFFSLLNLLLVKQKCCEHDSRKSSNFRSFLIIIIVALFKPRFALL